MEQGMEQPPLTYHQKYKRDHREDLNRKARDRYRDAMPREDVAQADLTAGYEQKRGITDYVVCRIEDCHVRRGRLPWHLRIFHKMKTAEYQRQFPGAPLECAALRESKATAGRARKGTLHYSTWGGKPRVEWQILRGVVEGKSAVEIGRDVARGKERVWAIAGELGLHAPLCYYTLGSLVTNAYVADLQKSLGMGMDLPSFAQLCRVHPSKLRPISRPKYAGHLGRFAPAVIETLDRVIREIYKRARKPGQRRLNTARFLRSVVPNLPELAATIREILAQSRDFLGEHDQRGLTDWQSWLCEKAQDETESGTSGPFSRFLPFAPEIYEFVEAKFPSLRSPRGGDLWAITSELLAARLGVSASVARNAELVRPLEPDEIRLILSKTPEVWRPESAAPAAPVSGKSARRPGSPGPEPTPFELTTWYRIGLEVERKKRDLISSGTPADKATELARTKVADVHPKTSRRSIALYHRHFLRYKRAH
jgi:hypothetical protein